MLDDLYSRQTNLGIRPIEQATVIGCGGTGTWVGLLLAMSGTSRLFLMDDDQLELSNLARLPYRIDQVGQPKTEALAEAIRALRPEAHVETYPAMNSHNFRLTEGVVFDCTDRHSTQIEISKLAKLANREYIRAGYDGAHITVTSKVPQWTTGGDRGYEVVPSWVVPAVIASAFGVAHHYSKKEVEGDIFEWGKIERQVFEATLPSINELSCSTTSIPVADIYNVDYLDEDYNEEND